MVMAMLHASSQWTASNIRSYSYARGEHTINKRPCDLLLLHSPNISREKIFTDFRGFLNNLESFSIENFVLNYNSILSLCNLRNIHHKDTQNHEPAKI